MKDEKSRLVYSTDGTVPRQKRLPEKPLKADTRQATQQLTVRLERKGRAGKTVTVVEGFKVSPAQREAVLKQAKARLGTGGAITGSGFEVQGDHRDFISALIEKMDHSPKGSGK